MSDTLRRHDLRPMAEALSEARHLLTRIEKAVLEPQSDGANLGLQAIDLLDQHLGDLVIWIRGLAEGVPQEKLVERLALGALRQSLTSQIQPLGRDAGDDGPAQQTPPAIEMF